MMARAANNLAQLPGRKTKIKAAARTCAHRMLGHTLQLSNGQERSPAAFPIVTRSTRAGDEAGTGRTMHQQCKFSSEMRGPHPQQKSSCLLWTLWAICSRHFGPDMARRNPRKVNLRISYTLFEDEARCVALTALTSVVHLEACIFLRHPGRSGH